MRKILIVSVGETPQVVTETLWALTAGREKKADWFIPDEMHLLTTALGREIIRDKLLGTNGKLEELCKEIGMPEVAVHMHGAGLEDVRQTEANLAFADAATRVIRDATSNRKTRVHVSMAGGRKSMSFYMGYAMSLFGRDDDTLSHVLVPREFEGCPDFWWIPKQPRQVVSLRDGKFYNTADARIELFEVPFLRLNHFVRPHLFEQAGIDYSRVVASMQEAIGVKRVRLVDDRRSLLIGDIEVKLPNQAYALYRTLADAAREQWPGAGPDGVGPGHSGWLKMEDFYSLDSPVLQAFLDHYDASFRGDNLQADNLRETIEKELGPYPYVTDHDRPSSGEESMLGRLNPLFSRIHNDLKKGIMDPVVLNRFAIHRARAPRGAGWRLARFGLLLQPDEIEIDASI